MKGQCNMVKKLKIVPVDLLEPYNLQIDKNLQLAFDVLYAQASGLRVE